nr:phosphatidylserine decarboxylase [Hymenolepis microstoma]
MFRSPIFILSKHLSRQNLRSLPSVPSKTPYTLKNLPHIFQPRILAGATVLTGSYFFYLWYSDNEKFPSAYRKNFEAVIYRRLPSNAFSHLIGTVSDIKIPPFLRRFVFGIYVSLAHCNMEEAKEPNIAMYSTLGELFSRELAPDFRPVDKSALLNCPCDGTVVCAGAVEGDQPMLAQVKGKTYGIEEFLGPLLPEKHLRAKAEGTESRLYQCVIYLCPGDYHRFHSPTDWIVKVRRHFTGKLLSVRPSFVRKIPGVYTLNERVVYLGEWRYGFMSLTAVGAAGVGSVVASGSLDPSLNTNPRSLEPQRALEPGLHFDEVFIPTAVEQLTSGAPVGYFKMGSTIVLVFEGPESGFEWTVKSGDKVKFGQALMRKERN